MKAALKNTEYVDEVFFNYSFYILSDFETNN